MFCRSLYTAFLFSTSPSIDANLLYSDSISTILIDLSLLISSNSSSFALIFLLNSSANRLLVESRFYNLYLNISFSCYISILILLLLSSSTLHSLNDYANSSLNVIFSNSNCCYASLSDFKLAYFLSNTLNYLWLSSNSLCSSAKLLHFYSYSIIDLLRALLTFSSPSTR